MRIEAVRHHAAPFRYAQHAAARIFSNPEEFEAITMACTSCDLKRIRDGGNGNVRTMYPQRREVVEGILQMGIQRCDVWTLDFQCSLQHMADILGFSVTRVQRAMRDLIDMGIVVQKTGAKSWVHDGKRYGRAAVRAFVRPLFEVLGVAKKWAACAAKFVRKETDEQRGAKSLKQASTEVLAKRMIKQRRDSG